MFREGSEVQLNMIRELSPGSRDWIRLGSEDNCLSGQVFQTEMIRKRFI